MKSYDLPAPTPGRISECEGLTSKRSLGYSVLVGAFSDSVVTATAMILVTTSDVKAASQLNSI